MECVTYWVRRRVRLGRSRAPVSRRWSCGRSMVDLHSMDQPAYGPPWSCGSSGRSRWDASRTRRQDRTARPADGDPHPTHSATPRHCPTTPRATRRDLDPTGCAVSAAWPHLQSPSQPCRIQLPSRTVRSSDENVVVQVIIIFILILTYAVVSWQIATIYTIYSNIRKVIKTPRALRWAMLSDRPNELITANKVKHARIWDKWDSGESRIFEWGGVKG